jgi:hypothetical protein
MSENDMEVRILDFTFLMTTALFIPAIVSTKEEIIGAARVIPKNTHVLVVL